MIRSDSLSPPHFLHIFKGANIALTEVHMALCLVGYFHIKFGVSSHLLTYILHTKAWLTDLQIQAEVKHHSYKQTEKLTKKSCTRHECCMQTVLNT